MDWVFPLPVDLGQQKKIAPKNLTDLDGTEAWKNGFKKRVRFGHFGDFPNKEIHLFGGLLLMFQKSQGQPPGMYQTL